MDIQHRLTQVVASWTEVATSGATSSTMTTMMIANDKQTTKTLIQQPLSVKSGH